MLRTAHHQAQCQVGGLELSATHSQAKCQADELEPRSTSCAAELADMDIASRLQDISSTVPVLRVLRRDPSAKLPYRGTSESAGLVIFASETVTIPLGDTHIVRTGISINPPPGTYPRLASRSSIASKGVDVTGGVVDPDYRGNIGVILHNHSPYPFDITVGKL